jgi:hypothetical protein
MYQETKTTKEKLQHTIQQARTNADTAQRIIKVLDQWGTKLFNKRFADTLRAEVGEGYEVYYSKSYDDWRLSVRTTSQRYDEGVSLHVGEHPTTTAARQQAEGWAGNLESEHIRAALFEVAHYGEICAEAARIAVEIRGMRAKYGKYDGNFTYAMREEVERTLKTA